MGYIKGEIRNQLLLFPESIEDAIADDNPVRVIDEYVEQLDLKELKFARATDLMKGRPPYHPKDLLKLYVYGYLTEYPSDKLPTSGIVANY